MASSNFTVTDEQRVSTLEQENANLKPRVAKNEADILLLDKTNYLNDISSNFVSDGFVATKSSTTMEVSFAKDTYARNRVYIAGKSVTIPDQTVTVEAADASLTRIDLLVASTGGSVLVLKGTAGSGQGDYSQLTDKMIVLYELSIPATVTNLSTATLTDKRVWYGHGPIMPSEYIAGKTFQLTATDGSYSAGIYLCLADGSWSPLVVASGIEDHDTYLSLFDKFTFNNIAGGIGGFGYNAYHDPVAGYCKYIESSRGAVDWQYNNDGSLVLKTAIAGTAGNTISWNTAMTVNEQGQVVIANGTISNASTASTLVTARNFSITGDVTASAVSFNGGNNVVLSTVLSNTGVTATTYGSSSQIPVITVDSKGRITSASNQTITSANNGTLTMNVGTYLSGSATFTANQSGNSTFTVGINATSANTANYIVARDASGNFSAGTISATLSGTASFSNNINVTASGATNLRFALLDPAYGSVAQQPIYKPIYSDVYINASTSTIYCPTFSGNLTGNATTATDLADGSHLSVAKGGTGASSFTSGYVPYYNGSVLTDSSLFFSSGNAYLYGNLYANHIQSISDAAILIKTNSSSTHVIVEGAGTSQGVLQFGSSSSGYKIAGGADYLGLIFWSNGSQAGVFDTSGNLGIGVASPAEKLDVSGNINFSGTLKRNGIDILDSYDNTTQNLVEAETDYLDTMSANITTTSILSSFTKFTEDIYFLGGLNTADLTNDTRLFVYKHGLNITTEITPNVNRPVIARNYTGNASEYDGKVLAVSGHAWNGNSVYSVIDSRNGYSVSNYSFSASESSASLINGNGVQIGSKCLHSITYLSGATLPGCKFLEIDLSDGSYTFHNITAAINTALGSTADDKIQEMFGSKRTNIIYTTHWDGTTVHIAEINYSTNTVVSTKSVSSMTGVTGFHLGLETEDHIYLFPNAVSGGTGDILIARIDKSIPLSDATSWNYFSFSPEGSAGADRATMSYSVFKPIYYRGSFTGRFVALATATVGATKVFGLIVDVFGKKYYTYSFKNSSIVATMSDSTNDKMLQSDIAVMDNGQFIAIVSYQDVSASTYNGAQLRKRQKLFFERPVKLI